MSIVYLDHAATTPCRKEVWEEMASYYLYDYGNPDSQHSLGRSARKAVEEARLSIAAHLGCSAGEIFFTSGGSESDSLALRGVAHANQDRGRHIITTRIEHQAVLNTCESLEAEGFIVDYLEVDEFGRVDPQEVLGSLREDTILVSIAHTNNEVGTIQPIELISKLIKAQRPAIIFHTDAVQAVGHVNVNVDLLGVDLLSFTAQKFYGPKGIGGLYVREGIKLRPYAGRSTNENLEPGTLSVPLIAGMSFALTLACERMEREQEHWTRVRDRIIDELLTIGDCRLNGHPVDRLATNISISFDGVNGEDVVLRLDRLDICTSTGAACKSGMVEPSHVLLAMGLPRRLALGSLRLSLGDGCRDIDPKWLVDQIKSVVATLRATSYTVSHSRLKSNDKIISPLRLMTA